MEPEPVADFMDGGLSPVHVRVFTPVDGIRCDNTPVAFKTAGEIRFAPRLRPRVSAGAAVSLVRLVEEVEIQSAVVAFVEGFAHFVPERLVASHFTCPGLVHVPPDLGLVVQETNARVVVGFGVRVLYDLDLLEHFGFLPLT